MRLVHLSDLHLSRYGESGTWTQRPEADAGWEPLEAWNRWQIEGLLKKGKRSKLRLLDPEGVIHGTRRWPARNENKAVGALLGRAMERHRTSAEVLCLDRPTGDDLHVMLRIDPDNTNLRFLRVVDIITPLDPDLVVITGDVTDNGFGYQLVEHHFRPWIDEGRLLVVPGNHDTYDMFPRKGRRAREAARVSNYRSFAKRVGMTPSRSGAWCRRLDDLAIIGFDSCKPPRTPFSASGAVSKEQLAWLEHLQRRRVFRDARLRVGLVHHHLLRIPFEVGKRSPVEMGLRLRNATTVMKACTAAGFELILNGHRHHGYVVKLPGRPTVVSAPSSTLGCKSSQQRYIWLLDLDERYPFPQLLPLDDESA